MKIIYGLANRCFTYGVRSSSSYSSIKSLSDLTSIGIIDFDGAEIYGWLLKDLIFFKRHSSLNVSTKITLLQLKNYLRSDSITTLYTIPSDSLDILYLHDRITPTLLKDFNYLLQSHDVLSTYVWGLSIYSNADIDMIESYRPKCAYIQAPLNPLTQLNISRLIEMGYKVIVRSIFHQGIYFANDSISVANFDEARFAIHCNQLLVYAHSLGISLGQLLFSYAQKKAESLMCNGVIIGSSSIPRISNYIETHRQIYSGLEIHEVDLTWYNELNADPRNWSQ